MGEKSDERSGIERRLIAASWEQNESEAGSSPGRLSELLGEAAETIGELRRALASYLEYERWQDPPKTPCECKRCRAARAALALLEKGGPGGADVRAE